MQQKAERIYKILEDNRLEITNINVNAIKASYTGKFILYIKSSGLTYDAYMLNILAHKLGDKFYQHEALKDNFSYNAQFKKLKALHVNAEKNFLEAYKSLNPEEHTYLVNGPSAYIGHQVSQLLSYLNNGETAEQKALSISFIKSILEKVQPMAKYILNTLEYFYKSSDEERLRTFVDSCFSLYFNFLFVTPGTVNIYLKQKDDTIANIKVEQEHKLCSIAVFNTLFVQCITIADQNKKLKNLDIQTVMAEIAKNNYRTEYG